MSGRVQSRGNETPSANDKNSISGYWLQPPRNETLRNTRFQTEN